MFSVLIITDAIPCVSRASLNDDRAEYSESPAYGSIDPWNSSHDDMEHSDTVKSSKLVIEQYISSILSNERDFCSDVMQVIIRNVQVTLLMDVVTFWKPVLGELSRALVSIDHSISTKTMHRVGEWQYLFGVWRSELADMTRDLESAYSRLRSFKEHAVFPKVDHQYSNLISACTMLQARNDRTSQALMSTLSIIESQNAIQQGHEFQKLTELAFIFIPLSFVASFYGMEVQVRYIENPNILEVINDFF